MGGWGALKAFSLRLTHNQIKGGWSIMKSRLFKVIRGLQESYYVGENYRGRWYGVYCVFYSLFHPRWFFNLLCRMFGHKLESECVGGGESAVEYINCTRCGWNKKITYY